MIKIRNLFKLKWDDLQLLNEPELKKTFFQLWFVVFLFVCMIWVHNTIDSRIIQKQKEGFNRIQAVQILIARQALDDHFRDITSRTLALLNTDLTDKGKNDYDKSIGENLQNFMTTVPDVVSVILSDETLNKKLFKYGNSTAQKAKLFELGEKLTKKLAINHSETAPLRLDKVTMLDKNPVIPLIIEKSPNRIKKNGFIISIIDMLPSLDRYIAPLKGMKYSVAYVIDEDGKSVYNRGGDMLKLSSPKSLLFLRDKLQSYPSGSSSYSPDTQNSRIIVNWDTMRFLNRKFFIVLAVPEKVLAETIQKDRTIRFFLSFFFFSSIMMVILLWINRKNRDEIRKRETRYQAIIDEQFELVIRFTPDGLYTFANDAYCNFFRKKRSEIVGHKISLALSKKRQKQIQEIVKVISPESPSNIREEKVYTPFGEIRYLSWTNRGIFNDTGELEEIQAVARDITDRNIAEQILENETRQMKKLHHIVQKLTLVHREKDLFQKLLDSLVGEMGYFCASIITVKDEKRETFSGIGQKVNPDPSIFEKALSEETPVTQRREDGFYQTSLPVSFQGKKLGILNVIQKTPPDNAELRILSILRDHFSGLWEITKLMKQRTMESFVDPLTGLWNRRYILKHIKMEENRLKRYGGKASLVMADLGDFKNINDTYGHLEGDEVLRGVASILRESTRTCDIVTRYGGDEFLLYLPDTTPEQAEKVVSRAAKRIWEHNFQARIFMDYGIAGYPQNGNHLLSVIKEADDRMYATKVLRKSNGLKR